jgi:hypothetical protein
LRLKTKLGLALGSLGLAAGVIAAGAPAASATTGACTSVLSTNCGTFKGTDVAGAPNTVYWDVKHGTVAAGTPVIGYIANSSSDRATDIAKVKHTGVVPGLAISNVDTISYSFVYAPNGQWSNLCVADTGTHLLVLRVCNGSQYQRFIAQVNPVASAPVAFTGTYPNNGRYIPSSGAGGPFSLQNVAFRGYIQDRAISTVAGDPDPRQLVDASVGTAFTSNQVWSWMP